MPPEAKAQAMAGARARTLVLSMAADQHRARRGWCKGSGSSRNRIVPEHYVCLDGAASAGVELGGAVLNMVMHHDAMLSSLEGSPCHSAKRTPPGGGSRPHDALLCLCVGFSPVAKGEGGLTFSKCDLPVPWKKGRKEGRKEGRK